VCGAMLDRFSVKYGEQATFCAIALTLR